MITTNDQSVTPYFKEINSFKACNCLRGMLSIYMPTLCIFDISENCHYNVGTNKAVFHAINTCTHKCSIAYMIN